MFGESSIVNALVEGFSVNPITGQVDAQGFQFYDTSVKSILVDVAFRNFQVTLDEFDWYLLKIASRAYPF